MEFLSIAMSVLPIVLACHSLIFCAATDWHLKQGRLLRAREWGAAATMDARRPWYVRYAAWLP